MPTLEPENHNADRRIVACKQYTLDTPLASMDLPAMRTRFAKLTDEASDILFGERLDFDDVIVDRFILAEANSLALLKVSADWLSDRERLIEHVASFVRKQINASDIAYVDAANIRITGLMVEIVLEAGPI